VEAEPPAFSEQSPETAGVAANRKLFAALYDDLRQLAERQLRRNEGASISPTTLLHEAYIGISGRSAVFADRERFMGYASRVMRGLIIDFVRERRALKRGAAFHITQLPSEIAQVDERQLARLSDVLDELARTTHVSPRSSTCAISAGSLSRTSPRSAGPPRAPYSGTGRRRARSSLRS
jgi:DNA-directed RNA polymerase specialized sigma24 family protein